MNSFFEEKFNWDERTTAEKLRPYFDKKRALENEIRGQTTLNNFVLVESDGKGGALSTNAFAEKFGPRVSSRRLFSVLKRMHELEEGSGETIVDEKVPEVEQTTKQIEKHHEKPKKSRRGRKRKRVESIDSGEDTVLAKEKDEGEVDRMVIEEMDVTNKNDLRKRRRSSRLETVPKKSLNEDGD